MTWKKSLIFCISFICVFFSEITLNLACGGGDEDPYDYFTSYFYNNLSGKEYQQFRYTEWTFLYDENKEDEEKEQEANINAKEWGDYLKISTEDAKLLYNSDSLLNEALNKVLKGEKEKFPTHLQNQAFYRALSKNKKALTYYAFAKSCEPYSNGNYDPWDPAVKDTVAMIRKAEESLSRLKTVKYDNFLSLRYAYQAVRMYHYAGSYENAIHTYLNSIENNKRQSAVKGWAMSLYAGAIRRNGNAAKASYLFAKVFASNAERRTQTYKDFSFASVPLDSSLIYAKTSVETAYVSAMYGFGYTELDETPLLNVYQHAPQSEMIPILLTREINKAESKLSPSYYDVVDTAAALAHVDKIKTFSIKLAREKKYPNPAFAWLSASYLSYLQDKNEEALTYLQYIDPTKLNEQYLKQYRIIDLLTNINQIKKSGEINVSKILPTLKWLDEKNVEDSTKTEEIFQFAKIYRDIYQQILAPIYLKRGDTVTNALLQLKGDSFKNNEDGWGFSKAMGRATTAFWQEKLTSKTMEKLDFLLRNPKSDGYDGLLSIALKNINKNDFYELLGTTYLRAHQYEKAIKCFEKISPDYKPIDFYSQYYYTHVIPSNPFASTINDYPKNFDDSITGINKYAFAKEMAKLKHLIKIDPKNAATYYFKMANAVYQTGYYGNANELINYNWSAYDYSNQNSNYYDDDYRLAITAKKWYLKARSLSSDANFKAKCTFMLAKCEQKKLINYGISNGGMLGTYNERFDNGDLKVMQLSFYNKYFKELKNSYVKTAYFKKAIWECNYLSDYLSRMEKKN